MKNSFHILSIFFFLALGQLCYAMVGTLLISNRANKNFVLRCEKEFQDLPKNENRIVELIWCLTANNTRRQAYIEFYDTDDPWHAECKKQKLCSFILYFQIFNADGREFYEAQLERRRPEVAMEKIFPKLGLYNLQRLTLIINDDLKESELTLVD